VNNRNSKLIKIKIFNKNKKTKSMINQNKQIRIGDRTLSKQKKREQNSA
jgi:hypothetical protein